MKQALGIAALLTAVFLAIDVASGLRVATAIGFAATAAIATFNAATFLWLWYVRATPLALGMALSWTGQAAISIWWFGEGLPGQSSWLERQELIFPVLALYIVGGGLHIAVVQRSAEARAMALVWPAIVVLSIAAGVGRAL